MIHPERQSHRVVSTIESRSRECPRSSVPRFWGSAGRGDGTVGSEVGEADLEVDFGGVAFDAVGEVEAEEGEDDVVEVDAEAGAEVGARVGGGELVGEVVAIGGAAALEGGVAGVVEGDGAEGEEAPFEEGMEYSARKTARRSPRNWSTL